MDVNGYIDYGNYLYTFVYKDNLLIMVLANQEELKKATIDFTSRKKVDFLYGKTTTGYKIAFYIDAFINEFFVTSKIFPKLVFLAKNPTVDLKTDTFNSIKFIGGVVNRFYSNKKIINSDLFNTKEIKLKSAEETVEQENIIIKNKKVIFQISISNLGWKYDGTVHFDNINSVIRLKHINKLKLTDAVTDILTINDLFFFCLNRRNIKYDKIILEMLDDNKKYNNVVEIYMPLKDNNFTQKYMLQYQFIAGKVDSLIKALSEKKYLTYIIPNDDNQYRNITASRYSSIFSAYQAIYNYTHEKENKIVYENEEFDDIKDEICNLIDSVSNRYKGVNSKKRKYAESFSNLIKNANLKLEKMVIDGINEFNFVVNTLPDAKYKNIMSNLETAVNTAVNDRDLITHDDVFAPSDTDIAVYLSLERTIYSMILRKIGINENTIKDIVTFLSFSNII